MTATGSVSAFYRSLGRVWTGSLFFPMAVGFLLEAGFRIAKPVQRQTRDRKVAGLIPGRSGRPHFSSSSKSTFCADFDSVSVALPC